MKIRPAQLLRDRLGARGLLTAFVIVDAVGVVVTMQQAQAMVLGLAAAAGALALAAAGYIARDSGRARLAITAGLIVLLLAVPQLALLQEEGPNSPLHDGVLLTDAAADRLIHGQNPYGHDYIDSPARAFYLSDMPVNFGLRHYVYTPALILLDAPVRYLAPLAGGRLGLAWLFLPALLVLAAAAWSLGTSVRESHVAMTVVVLNPLVGLDYIHFVNDVFFLAPALAAVGMARRDRPLLAGALFGLALATKQQAALFAPFLLMFGYLHWDSRRVAVAGGAALASAGALVLPFLAWNPGAFIGDVATFFYGSGVDAYPIRGLGLPGLLLRAGIVPSRWAPFPASAPLQIIATLLVLVAAVRGLRRCWSWPAFWAWMGLESLAVFLVGRVLAPNYLDVALTLALLGGALWLVEEAPAGAVARDVDGSSRKRGIVEAAAGDDLGDLAAADRVADQPAPKVEPLDGPGQVGIDRSHRRGQPG
jgi:hypothetical protein